MKRVIFALFIAVISISAQADVTVKESRAAGLLYGFLSTIEQPQNAGDGVLIVSAEIVCTKHVAQSKVASDSYYCMADIGGITGDLAESVYLQLPKKLEQNIDDITVRTGNASCFSVEETGKAARFECK